MKKRLAALFLASVVLILSLVTPTFALSPTDLELEKEARSLEAYAGLLEDLELKDAVRISPHLPVMPEYYCGAYLDEQGQLNLMLKENAPISAAELMRQHSGSTILEHTALYSFNELNRVIETINRKLRASSSPVLNDLVCAYLDEEANCIVVELQDLTAEKISAFKSTVCNHGCLVFREGTELPALEDDPLLSETIEDDLTGVQAVAQSTVARPLALKIGRKIRLEYAPVDQAAYPGYYGASALSIGMNVTLDGQAGFLTAGHGYRHNIERTCKNGSSSEILVCNPTGRVYIVDDDVPGKPEIFIGEVVPREVKYGGSLDSMFVKLVAPTDRNGTPLPNYTVTVSTQTSNNLIVSALEELGPPVDILDPETGNFIPQGAAVTAYAAHTVTPSTSPGHVLSINYTANPKTPAPSTPSLTNMIKTSILTQHGDSGGMLGSMWMPFPNRVAFCGILSGVTSDGSYSTAYSTLKYYYANRITWNVSPLS